MRASARFRPVVRFIFASTLISMMVTGKAFPASGVAADPTGQRMLSSTASTPEVTVSYLSGGLWRYTGAMAVAGDYFYFGLNHGFEVLDVSDPWAPAVVHRVHLVGGNNALATTDHYLFAQEEKTLRIYDRSNPGSPVELGSCGMGPYTEPWVRDIVAVDDVVFLSSYWIGVGVINMEDPHSPFQEGTLQPNYSRSIDVSGSTLLIAGEDGLLLYSLADPHHPELAGYEQFNGYDPNDVVSMANHAYIPRAEAGLRIFDIGLPGGPTTVAEFDSGGSSLRSAIVGSYLYVAAQYAGLDIYDLSNPVAPSFMGNAPTGDNVAYVTASGNFVYVGNGGVGMQVIDATDPAHPTLAGSHPQNYGYCTDVAVAGHYAYVTQMGLKVISLEDPALPQRVGWWRDLSRPYYSALAVKGDYVYVSGSDASAGVWVVSVTDPAAPLPIGFVDTYSGVQGLSIDGSLLYAADGNLRIVDISDPQAPLLLSGLVSPGDASDVCVGGQFAYLADGEAGVFIADVSDPTHPVTVGSIASPGLALGVNLVGNRLYLAAGPAGLAIFDVSDPHSPSLLGQHDTPGIARRVKLSGDYAVVADQDGGIQIINVSNPATSYLYTAASYNTRSSVQDLTVDGDRLVVATGDEMQVLTLTVSSIGYLVGDPNADSSVTSSDVIYLVNFVFKGGPQPLINYRSGDIDCNGPINSGDLIKLVNFVFKGGAAPSCP